MKNSCIDLKEHTKKYIYIYEKKKKKKRKEMIALRNEEEKLHRKQKVCYICKNGFSTDDNNEGYHKVRFHSHYTGKYRAAVHDILRKKWSFPLRISSVNVTKSADSCGFVHIYWRNP